MTTYKLSPDAYAATTAKIGQINQRATKRGFTGHLTYSVEWRTEREHDPYSTQSWDAVYAYTTITGDAPCYGGWTFLAAVDTLPSDDPDQPEYVLRYAPGVQPTDIDRANLVCGRCQHCNTAKRNRKYTFLLRHTDTGQTMQIGSTCIQDFTGWQGKPIFVSVSDVDHEVEGHTSGGLAGQSPVDVVTVAYAAVRELGWTPASHQHGFPTKEVVLNYFYGRSSQDTALREQLAPWIAEGWEKAPQILETLRTELAGEPGYEANLIAALRALYVEPKQYGLVVSAISAYDRLMGRKARQGTEPDRSQVVHQGTVGEKLTVRGIVTRCLPVHSAYGTTTLVILETGTTVIKMFTTAKWVDDIETGHQVTLLGKVKAHEHYQGIPQTVLTRCKRTDENDVTSDEVTAPGHQSAQNCRTAQLL